MVEVTATIGLQSLNLVTTKRLGLLVLPTARCFCLAVVEELGQLQVVEATPIRLPPAHGWRP